MRENIDVIQQMLPNLYALRPLIEVHKDDPDRIRGYSRLLCEAGERYVDVIVAETQETLPLVQAIAACTAYPNDIDLVCMTGEFWYRLKYEIGPQSTGLAKHNPIFEIYAQLQMIIIKHLHFPRDDEDQTAQERDEFRMYRHDMGDMLKDCCFVLGAGPCLQRSFEMLTAALANPSTRWQEIEAPLFSLRSMGSAVDMSNEGVMLEIMELLPKLPDHPRIQYAAILVIARYTQWLNRHPQYLAFQLQYISTAFEMGEDEVSAAAAQAMNHMFEDCRDHLIPYIPQLHSFVMSIGVRLDQAHLLEICEAIGHVIASMPADDAAQTLQRFCEPLFQRLRTVAEASSEVPKADLQRAAGKYPIQECADEKTPWSRYKPT